MRVMREVRFSLGPDPSVPVTNSYAGWPTAHGIQPWLTLGTVLEGRPDARTGYLVNITAIDRLLRDRSIPLIRRRCEAGDDDPAPLIADVADDLRSHAPAGSRWIAWHLKPTPYLTFSIEAVPAGLPPGAIASGASDMLSLTHTFEFAAAHRLHCPEMSADENLACFGKCNNPNGHGHNYVLEVTVSSAVNAPAPAPLPLVRLEQMVKARVIDRFDHKHLNEDCVEFADVNPSVENIARIIWRLLEGELSPARLTRVRVWETAKTYAEYDGQD